MHTLKRIYCYIYQKIPAPEEVKPVQQKPEEKKPEEKKPVPEKKKGSCYSRSDSIISILRKILEYDNKFN